MKKPLAVFVNAVALVALLMFAPTKASAQVNIYISPGYGHGVTIVPDGSRLRHACCEDPLIAGHPSSSSVRRFARSGTSVANWRTGWDSDPHCFISRP